ncbi:MAG TPA: hypothetical protein GX736_01870 [Mogibacterium sp.]|nr:hypothetical protein [Mogibacterium sp.]
MNYAGFYGIVIFESCFPIFSTTTKNEPVSIITKAEAEISKALEYGKKAKGFRDISARNRKCRNNVIVKGVRVL